MNVHIHTCIEILVDKTFYKEVLFLDSEMNFSSDAYAVVYYNGG